MLEGSVQRGGNRMRVNVQLIDAENGNHLWAERFDKPLADLFDMQDEIVARLTNTLDAQLISAEARRAEQTPNPNSMDLYFQGLAWLNKGRTAPDSLAEAHGFFDRALAADPDNVDALVRSAYTDILAGTYAFVADPETAFAAAEAKLTRALSSVPDHAVGHMWLVSKYSPSGPQRASPNVSMRWRWIEISHSRMPISEWESTRSVAPKKQRFTLAKPCASVREIRLLMFGCMPRAPQRANSATWSRRSRGFGGRLRSTEAIR